MASSETLGGQAVSRDMLLEAIVGAAPPGRSEELLRFARIFLRRVPEEDLSSRDPLDWAAMLADWLGFLRERRAETVKLRIFEPNRETHGWGSEHSVIEIVNDDMPFLVDSVSMAVAAAGYAIHALFHPVVAVDRDPSGHLLGFSADAGRMRESLIHLEIDRIAEPQDAIALKASIEHALAEVRVAVRDWNAMRQRMLALAGDLESLQAPVAAEEREEIRALLEWLAADHFTFLGYREYRRVERDGRDWLEAVPGTGLGILRDEMRPSKPRPLDSLAVPSGEMEAAADALILTKTNARSLVHRPGYMDYVGLLQFDARGRPIGERRFVGLFTSSAYNRRPWEIPLVRRKFERVMQQSGLAPEGHSGKALRHILETLPRDELFHAPVEELERIAIGILNLQERQRTRLFIRRDRYGRFFSCLAFIPRDRFNTGTRLRIEELLMRALDGERCDSQVMVGESTLARLHLVIRPKPGSVRDFSAPQLEAEIARIVRDWFDELREVLVQRHGEEKGLKLAHRYGRSLPAGYIERVRPALAAIDVEELSRLRDASDLRIQLYRLERDPPEVLRLKLFRWGSPIALSDALPLLESLGLRVISEHPYTVQLAGGAAAIQDFELVPAAARAVEVDEVRSRLVEAFLGLWRGTYECDRFNRLIVEAGLDARQVSVLRAYCKYLLQLGVPFSQAYMEQAFAAHPEIALLLTELFEARFDPRRELEVAVAQASAPAIRERLLAVLGAPLRERLASHLEGIAFRRAEPRETQVESVRQALSAALDLVDSLDQDRIFRLFMTLIEATLRTNAYQRHEGRPGEALAFKFDPQRIPELPKPRPYREIFVYSPRVEGVHLRFGPVARGGLRWSDRREDFRTEVLGLVKAQMVKNTIIVPVGAKGGFYVKQPPSGGDRDAVLAEGVACYRIFINALLDLTDNRVDGRIVRPPDTVCHDGEDPYLVVAADKGTATFSDIANAVALERGFWLGDAFASGGSHGYDHKKMGITAKGAWESVKRHFRALGRDCQNEPFTCVGIGDMSGDVFGNGMLLSRQIRLIAAFDHRHIFIDPDPDPARSFAERERLFRLPRSSWDDYDKTLISRGGGVYPRSAKSIRLSPEARQALGLSGGGEAMTPAEVIRAILRAPVDLLWNGGIGTYVKASSETHGEVGDRANDALRVDGRELRCKVVGEGGNLGFTQRGRVEAAQNGVLLNTDFIDNSAGVDTSDHEVNIKILLGDAVRRGELTLDERNRLLAAMTAEVESLVLWDNYRQNQAISLMERLSVARLGAKQHFVRVLEGRGILDRELEGLPSEAEFKERRARGQGLTRPELAVLLSYSKIVLYQELIASDVPEDGYLGRELARYFPEPLRERFAEHMARHPLKREIIATAVTNSLVNRMGSTFVLRMQEDTARSSGEIAKAFTAAREIFNARGLWERIDALDGKVPDAVQIDALIGIWSLLRHATRWLLNDPLGRSDIAGAVNRYASGVAELWDRLPETLAASGLRQWEERLAAWRERGLPGDIAEPLAGTPSLAAALDVVEIAQRAHGSVTEAARAYFALGDALHLDWLLERIENLEVEGFWHANARGALRDELLSHQRTLTVSLLERMDGRFDPEVLAAWIGSGEPTLHAARSMLESMRSLVRMDYATVLVAVRRVAQLAASPLVAER